MRSMTKNELIDFLNSFLSVTGETEKEYYIRLTRAYYPTPQVFFEGKLKLYFQYAPNGQLYLVTPASICWAEYSLEQIEEWEGAGILMAEDYQMEILIEDEL